MKAALAAMTVKTDRNDARGLAQIVRTGWFKAVHLKSPASQRHRTLMTARKFLVRSMTATEQAIRGLLRPFGMMIGAVTRPRFGMAVRELVAGDPILPALSSLSCPHTSGWWPRRGACTSCCCRRSDRIKFAEG